DVILFPQLRPDRPA
ncbi:MAG: hypothetical protein KC545_07120, partial [Nitrospira sp.]|nr:hypothetical protein [Nitrospira sp.]